MRYAIKRERSGRMVVFRAEAPAGTVWSSTGTHEVLAECYSGDKRWEIPTRRQVEEDVAPGFEPCPDRPDCDWCDE